MSKNQKSGQASKKSGGSKSIKPLVATLVTDFFHAFAPEPHSREADLTDEEILEAIKTCQPPEKERKITPPTNPCVQHQNSANDIQSASPSKQAPQEKSAKQIGPTPHGVPGPQHTSNREITPKQTAETNRAIVSTEKLVGVMQTAPSRVNSALVNLKAPQTVSKGSPHPTQPNSNAFPETPEQTGSQSSQDQATETQRPTPPQTEQKPETPSNNAVVPRLNKERPIGTRQDGASTALPLKSYLPGRLSGGLPDLPPSPVVRWILNESNSFSPAHKQRLPPQGSPMEPAVQHKRVLLSIMSAVTIAMNPFTKLYEGINENLKENTAMQATMLSKLTFLEGYITALDDKFKTLKLVMEQGHKDTANLLTSSCLGDKQGGQISSAQPSLPPSSTVPHKLLDLGSPIPEPQEVIVITDETANASLPSKPAVRVVDPSYPLFTGTRPEKPPRGGKSESQNPNSAKQSSLRSSKKKEKERNLARSPAANQSTLKASPRTSENFLVDEVLMNISQHFEDTQDPPPDKNGKMPQPPNPQTPSPKGDQNAKKENPKESSEEDSTYNFITLEERRKILQRRKPATSRSPMSSRAVSFTYPPAREGPTCKKSASGVQYSPQQTRRTQDFHLKSKEDTYSEPRKTDKRGQHPRPHFISRTEQHRKRHGSVRESPIKLEQHAENDDDIILNRRGILMLFSLIPTLRKIKSSDLKIIDPYHSNERAKAYIYPVSKHTKTKIADATNDLAALGYIVQRDPQNSQRREKAQPERKPVRKDKIPEKEKKAELRRLPELIRTVVNSSSKSHESH
ncbi:nucleolar and coiled-body phosphoprotein 1-like [Ambystoma mexicanum]|uniref:nucleolar and coiled-body phosphoprotein 1-like n=1 Tax=Ambystoma mexicanum TaxID=8296 RepID=UPI0037E7030B